MPAYGAILYYRLLLTMLIFDIVLETVLVSQPTTDNQEWFVPSLFHRENTTLQKHAMDWISQARFLQPPIDQVEIVDQIISHFSFNVSLALRGLLITTTNELIQ